MNAKKIVIPAVMLFIISAVCTFLLSFVNGMTAPIIAAQRDAASNEARAEVLEAAKDFEQLDLDGSIDMITTVYEGSDGGTVVGYVFNITTPGYGGNIDMMVGMDASGVIQGVRILDHSETAGLGAKAADPAFYEQYDGKSGILSVTGGTPSDQEIQAITSATITSNYVTSGVNAATEYFETVLGGAQ